VDVEESERLTRRIARAEERGDAARAERLRARREEIDERFNPDDALQGAGRYLAIAEERFGSEELAVVSYHMGIGNLEDVLAAYGEEDVSWAQVYFDATPSDHPETYELLSGFGDDSATYLWRVYAAREIMRLYREDQDELRALARLQTAKASAEEVLHPRSETDVFETPGELDEAYLSGDLRPFADVEGMQLDPDVGELAGRIDAERRLYRGLRPEALELAVYLAAGVREVAGTQASLIVTSTVRDLEYQRVLARLQTAKASAEEVLHPRSETDVFETPGELDEAYLSGDLRPFADVEGMQLDPDVGELAGRIDAERRLYRGLRPEALELAVYLAAGVRDVAGTQASLIVTSTVRDLEYQRVLARRNDFATEGYSLHTTGFAFDVRRDYASRDQAVAFEYMLDRLQSLSLIAWIREPGAIHITASAEAASLIP
jgi:Transglycosylase SLT domain